MNHDEATTQDSIQQIIKQKRETFRVQIRKEKVDNDFRMKRQNILSASKINSQQKHETGDSYPLQPDLQIIEKYMQAWYRTLIDAQNSNQYNIITKTLLVIKDYLYLGDGFLKVFFLKQKDQQLKLFCFKKYNFMDLFNGLFESCDKSQLEQREVLDAILESLQNFFCLDVFDDKEQLNNKIFMNKLISLLDFPQMQSQIFYLLANLIAFTTLGDHIKKSILIEYNITSKLHELWSQRQICQSEESLNNLSWFLSNFIGPHPDIHISQVQKLLPIVFACCHLNNTEIQKNSLLILSNAAQQRNDLITFIVQNELLVKKILDMALLSNNEVMAINLLANLMAGKDKDIKKLLSLGILDYLEKIFMGQQSIKKIKCQIIWALANACAMQDIDSLYLIIKHQILKRVLMEVAQIDALCRKELAFLIKNLSLISDLQALKQIILIEGIVEAIIFFLSMEYQEEDIVTLSFESINNFARKFQTVEVQCGANQAIEFFNARGLQNILNKLQSSPNDAIQRHSIKIYELYYL